jgi:hypothetical protein
VDGVEVAPSFSGLVTMNGLENPINLDENGKSYSASTRAWTGLNPDGTRVADILAGQSADCAGWTETVVSGKNQYAVQGTVTSKTSTWSYETNGVGYCITTSDAPFYCFQQ